MPDSDPESGAPQPLLPKIRESKALYLKIVTLLFHAEGKALDDLEIRKLFLETYKRVVGSSETPLLSGFEPGTIIDAGTAGEIAAAIRELKDLTDGIWLELQPGVSAFTRKTPDGQEILNEFFLNDFMNLIITFRDDGAPFENLLKVSLRNKRMYWEVCKRRDAGRLKDLPAETDPSAPTVQGEQEQYLIGQELGELFKRYAKRWGRGAVRELHAVRLHHLEGCKYSEIAEELGISENYARQIVHRALNKLRQLLEEAEQ